VTITQPTAVVASATPTAPQCNEALTVHQRHPARAAPDDTYSKDGVTFQASGLFSGLPAGDYTDHGERLTRLPRTKAVTITQPAAVTASATPTAPHATEALTVSISASAWVARRYTFSKDGVNFQASGLTGLAAGDYTITAKDSHNCLGTKAVTIPKPRQ